MPAYKLYYFPFRARAEAIRYLFAEAGVEFEDHFITKEDWPNHKQSMPFRQMPVLEIDGKQLAQSYAILRYLASEFGLAGKNKWEVAEADQFAGAVEDVFLPMVKCFLEKDEERKADLLKKLKEESAPNVLQAIEAALSKNSSGFLVGDRLTYADLVLLSLQESMEGMLQENSKDIFSGFPNIQTHREKIQSLPKIADWIKKRPQSPF